MIFLIFYDYFFSQSIILITLKSVVLTFFSQFIILITLKSAVLTFFSQSIMLITLKSVVLTFFFTVHHINHLEICGSDFFSQFIILITLKSVVLTFFKNTKPRTLRQSTSCYSPFMKLP